jgi:hypothetical protein
MPSTGGASHELSEYFCSVAFAVPGASDASNAADATNATNAADATNAAANGAASGASIWSRADSIVRSDKQLIEPGAVAIPHAKPGVALSGNREQFDQPSAENHAEIS